MITTVSYTIINQRDGLQNTNRKKKKKKEAAKEMGRFLDI